MTNDCRSITSPILTSPLSHLSALSIILSLTIYSFFIPLSTPPSPPFHSNTPDLFPPRPNLQFLISSVYFPYHSSSLLLHFILPPLHILHHSSLPHSTILIFTYPLYTFSLLHFLSPTFLLRHFSSPSRFLSLTFPLPHVSSPPRFLPPRFLSPTFPLSHVSSPSLPHSLTPHSLTPHSLLLPIRHDP